MTAAAKLQLVSVHDYLADELVSEIKHEFLGGSVYAMAGARIGHNHIVGNVFAILHAKLRGRPCRPYNSDTKIRVKLPTHVRFYYPDASVVCESNPPDASFQDRPVLVVEVLSNKTRRVDMGEKRDAYLSIPSLNSYLLLEQSQRAAILFRRTDQGFVQDEFAADHVIPLPDLGIMLAMTEIYEGVELVPEPEEEE